MLITILIYFSFFNIYVTIVWVLFGICMLLDKIDLKKK